MRRWVHRTSATHLVDDAGLVGCPVRGRDVGLDACLTCGQLEDVVEVDGVVTEIRCHGAQLPRDPATVGLGWPPASWLSHAERTSAGR